MNTLKELIERMSPDEAMASITVAVKALFPYVSDKVRLEFLLAFTDEASEEHLPGLVHR